MAQTKVQLLQPDLGDVIDFDASTLFVDGADNRIGIRNTNPQYELDVTGTVKATNFIGSGSTTIADWIVHDGDTNTKFGFPAADTYTVETAGSERLRINSNGTVHTNMTGTAPTWLGNTIACREKFSVFQGANFGEACFNIDVDNANSFLSHNMYYNSGWRIKKTGQPVRHLEIGTNGWRFMTGADGANDAVSALTERLRITSGGNLKAPDGAKIELGGAQTGAGDLSIWHDSGGNSYIKETGGGALVINADDFYLQNVATTTLLRTHSSGAIELTFNGTKKLETDNDGIRIGSGGGDNTIVDLHNASYDNGVIQYYNGSIALKTGSSNGDRTFQVHTAGDERLRIDSNGLMGLGITPTSHNNTTAFQIYDDHNSQGYPRFRLTNQSSGSASSDGYEIMLNGSDLDAVHRQRENADIYFMTNNLERLRISSDGNVFLHGNGATGSNNTTTRLPNGYTFNIAGDSSNDGISIVRYNSTYGAYGLNIGRSRSNTIGTNTAVADGNELGHITFYGADGNDFEPAAQITAIVDGEVASSGDTSDMPGALSFRTTDDGSNSPTEKLRIDKNGMVHIKGTNHATRYFRDDGNRYGSIFYDGGNFTIKSPQNDHTQITNWGGTVLAKFHNDTTIDIPGGVIQLGTANSSSGHLSAYENMTFNIDSDNDDTNRTFKWYHNGATGNGTELMALDEYGSLNVKGNTISVKNNLVNSYNSSWAVASGQITLRGDLGGGNYFGWRQKGVASGSVTQANAEKKLPTINDFTYPNSSNGMLIASTSKIGFSASGESPQYSTGVRMLFDGDLGLGGTNAYDCNDSVLNSTNTNIIMRGGNGRIGFHMNGSAPAQAIHIEGGTQTSNRGIYGDWDYGSSTSGQSGANYMLLEDKRWRINRGNPLIHLYAYNNSENSNGSGSYTSRVMKIDMNTSYTQEVNNDYMYGIDINVNTTNVSQVRALKTNGDIDCRALYLRDYHMAARHSSDSNSKEWGHWRGCIGGNNGWNGDNRSPKPHDFPRGRGMACIFTQKNGNSSGNYMDAMHFSTYSDSSGGNPNLFMINKSNNNVRVIRGAWDASNDMDDQTYNNYSIYDLNYTSGSDLRLKEDINTITSNTALSLVTQLRPVTFKWKDEYINSGFSKNEKENEYTEEEPLTEGGPKRQVRKPLSSADKVVNVGLIAQEVESVIPTVVHDGHVGLQDEDGANYKNIDYDKLVPYLIGAIKELKSQNDDLKARVTALES